jgi:hypothetical protein
MCPTGKIINQVTGICIIDRRPKSKTNTNVLSKKVKKPTCPSIIHDITKKKLQFIGSGEGGIVFRMDNINDTYALKLSIADNDYKFDKNHPVNIEDSMLKEIEKLRLKGISPHFNPFYGSTKCNLKSILDKLTNSGYISEDYQSHLMKFYSSTPDNFYYRIFLSNFVDGNLKSYLLHNSKKKRTQKYYKALLFHSCYSLSCLQYNIKGFRHNDLHLENVFIKINSKTLIQPQKVSEYEIFGKKYYIPLLDINPIIADFDFASSDKYQNTKIADQYNYGNYGINYNRNPYFDLHLLINMLLEEFPDCKSTYGKIYPSDILGTDNKNGNTRMCRLTIEREDITTPAEFILFHEIFNEFKKVPKGAEIVDRFKASIPAYDKIKKRSDMFNVYLD